jgi:hypothetical protein
LTIKSAQHTKNRYQFSAVSGQQDALRRLTVNCQLSTVNCPSRRSPMLPHPSTYTGRASTGRHRTISCQRTLSAEGLAIDPRPRFQFGPSAFAFSPKKLGLVPPIHRGHQAQLLL